MMYFPLGCDLLSDLTNNIWREYFLHSLNLANFDALFYKLELQTGKYYLCPKGSRDCSFLSSSRYIINIDLRYLHVLFEVCKFASMQGSRKLSCFYMVDTRFKHFKISNDEQEFYTKYSTKNKK